MKWHLKLIEELEMDGTHIDGTIFTQRPSGLCKFVKRLKRLVQDMILRQELRGQLAPLVEYDDPRGIVDGLGIHRYQVPAFIQGNPAANRLLPRMARRMGINLYRDVDTGERNGMIVTCSLCNAQKACSKWMDKVPGSDRPEYCRNGIELDEFKRRANR